VTRQRSVGWLKDDALGVEWADITLDMDRLEATIVAIGTDPVPYRLDAVLETGQDWITRRLRATTRGAGWQRELDLRRSSDGVWSIETEAAGEPDLPSPGGASDALAGADDCDLGLSPVTNSMPVLRDGLLDRDGDRTYRMAWVEVPSLRVLSSPQAYATSGHDADDRRLIEYRSLDSDFVALLTFDEDGLVVDYPGLARRLTPTARSG
jgi:hypothetical protein